MTSVDNASLICDAVPQDAPCNAEIGFRVPDVYNASAILFDNLAAGRSNRVAVTGPGGTRTYGELAEEASIFAIGLLSVGLARGDRVLLFLDDTPACPAVFMGAIRVGLVPMLINTLTPPDLLQFYLADSSAEVAVCDAIFADRFNATACEGTSLQHLVVVNGEPPASAPVPTVAADRWHFARGPMPAAGTRRDDMAFWMYSSGSTGRPKGIVHLQHDMLYTHRSYAKHLLKLTPDDVCFSVPKIFFAYGLGNSLTFPFAAGAAAVLLSGQPKPDAIFDCIRRFRPTVFFGLPTLYTALSKASEAQTTDFSSLRLCVSAAEILAAEVFNAWKALSGHEVMEGLGSSEAVHIYLSNLAGKKKPGSAGKRVPGYEVVLRDTAGREVCDNQEGILWVRGDSNAPGYWNRPDKTAETMRDAGWLFTGDRFVRDEDGFHFFRGRADDLVKISGQWVYPLEVELCLADHPSVRECAVVAVSQANQLTLLKAFVVLEDGNGPPDGMTATLQEYVKGRLLPYKYPRVIEYLDTLPKTGTGKINRQALLRTGSKS